LTIADREARKTDTIMKGLVGRRGVSGEENGSETMVDDL